MIFHKDSKFLVDDLSENSVHSVVTDPPYGIHLFSKKWDKVLPDAQIWQACYKVLRPGGFLLAFGHTRVYHRLACQLEDVGFDIKDCLCWAYACISEDTEILTEHGWSTIDEISGSDKVMTFNISKDTLEFKRIKHVHRYDFCGNLIHLKNRDTDQLLTPNHRILKKYTHHSGSKVWEEKDWNFIDASKIQSKKGVRLPLAAKFKGNRSVGVEFAALLGWVLSEGSYDRQYVRISQSSVNEKYVYEIRTLLNNLDFDYAEYIRNRKRKDGSEYKEHDFCIKRDAVFKIRKEIPHKKPHMGLIKLVYNERQALFDALIKGDGSFNGKAWTFYQKDDEFREWFRILSLSLGYRTLENKSKMCIHVNPHSHTQLQRVHFNKTALQKMYTGRVWCVTTSNETIVCKRNGRIFITGNSGFPHSLDIGKALDDSNWSGWGTQLKPAWEPIILAQKPLEGIYVENVMKYNVGGLNIDECRIPYKDEDDMKSIASFENFVGKNHGDERYFSANIGNKKQCNIHPLGRWPANLVWMEPMFAQYDHIFMIPKPSKKEKGQENTHETVKPIELMERLIRLVTPRPSIVGEEVLVLDPFMGSGSTGVAASNLGRKFYGYENNEDSYVIAKSRLQAKVKYFDMFAR